jgi:hypothetical protein
VSVEFFESSNFRPGEELRSWKPDDTEPSIVREHNFHTACEVASAGDALRRLRSGAELDAEDVRHLAELNSWAVQIWYVPPVFFYQGRIMLAPDVEDLVDALGRQ